MNTLGESARVNISPQTLALAQMPLDKKKRKELQREQVMSFIRRRPLGSRITDEELKQAGNFDNAPNARNFVLRMVKDGFITRENLTPRTYTYAVMENEKVRVVKQADPMRKKYTLTEVTQMAIQWSWEHQHSHNDLHGFIESINKKEKSNENTSRNTDTRVTVSTREEGSDTSSAVPNDQPS